MEKVTDGLIAMIERLKPFLEEGKSVLLPIYGRSMRPFIIGGEDKALLLPVKSPVEVGDIVLAWVDGRRYVVHRVVKTVGDSVTLEGDGNIIGEEHCSQADVVAKVEEVVRPDGRKKNLVSRSAMRGWRVWMALKPFRRIMLKAFSVLVLGEPIRQKKQQRT